MEKQSKRFYNVPKAELIEIKSEQCILLASNTERPNEGTPEWGWEDDSEVKQEISLDW